MNDASKVVAQVRNTIFFKNIYVVNIATSNTTLITFNEKKLFYQAFPR